MPAILPFHTSSHRKETAQPSGPCSGLLANVHISIGKTDLHVMRPAPARGALVSRGVCHAKRPGICLGYTRNFRHIVTLIMLLAD